MRSFLEIAQDDRQRRRGWEYMARLARRQGDVIDEVHALVELATLPETDFEDISEAINRVNSLMQDLRNNMDREDLQALLGHLGQTAEKRIGEGDATDCSRLAWLFLNLRDRAKATYYTNRGLALEPSNEYCLGLRQRLAHA